MVRVRTVIFLGLVNKSIAKVHKYLCTSNLSSHIRLKETSHVSQSPTILLCVIHVVGSLLVALLTNNRFYHTTLQMIRKAQKQRSALKAHE